MYFKTNSGAYACDELQKRRKRTELSIRDKQEGLKPLGYNKDGSKLDVQVKPATASKWTQKDVAIKYGVVKSTESGWIKNTKTILAQAPRDGYHKNRERLNEG